MSTCLSEDDLYRFQAGDLDEVESERFRRHLEACPDCRRREAEFVWRNEALAPEVHGVFGGLDPDVPSTGNRHTESPAQVSIGGYRLLQKLGEGGMGIVYLAEQQTPRRKVALKVIKPGMDSRAVIARFEAERQALALMDHPNLARVYDAGVTDAATGSRPYVVMEHVAGVSITEHCDRHKLGIEERLNLFMQVCDAVQHAHQKGVIHRDIKPGNILVSVMDGGAVPKVIDFGVAKAIGQRLTEKTLFTEQGQLMGTPAYMSPEQAEMTAQDIDTRSDIYSLGVLLYELLTGSLPFDPQSLRHAAFAEILRIIREVEPPKPSMRLSGLNREPRTSVRPDVSAASGAPGNQSGRTEVRGSRLEAIALRRQMESKTLLRRLRGDLDWITMKALEKDRTRRYASASDLASDIRRHLSHEPVVAGPPSAVYRIKKFARRHRGAVIAATLVAASLVAGLVGTATFAAREAHERKRADQKAAEAVAERDRAVRAEAEQSRARQEAEIARAAEEEQRRLAEERADQTNQVAAFQMSQLSGIDAARMGARLRRDLLDRAREAALTTGHDEDAAGERVATLEQALAGVNFTDAALKSLDENIFTGALKAIDEQFKDQPLVRARLLQTVAEALRDLGLLDRAMAPQTEALEIRRRILGNEHDTLVSINVMGLLLKSMGRLDEAVPYYREALDTRRRVLGSEHPDTLESLNNMGNLLQSMGRLDEALSYCREALDGSRRVLGDEHPDTLISINNMGTLLQSMGRMDEALPYCREAMDTRRRVLGDEHPTTLNSINNMGALLQSTGRLDEALPYYREALEHFRRILGDEHPTTLSSINNMGVLLGLMGNRKESMPYLREYLERCRRVHGNEHPQTLHAIENMSSLLHWMGDLDETEPLCREALDTRRRVLGNEHPDTLRSISNLGVLLRARGRLDEAEQMLLEAAAGVEKLPPTHNLRNWVSESLMKLYDARHAAEPGAGYDAKAAVWRAKLEQWQASTQPTTTQTAPSAASSQPVVGSASTQPGSQPADRP